jgi:hypothetical protein
MSHCAGDPKLYFWIGWSTYRHCLVVSDVITSDSQDVHWPVLSTNDVIVGNPTIRCMYVLSSPDRTSSQLIFSCTVLFCTDRMSSVNLKLYCPVLSCLHMISSLLILTCIALSCPYMWDITSWWPHATIYPGLFTCDNISGVTKLYTVLVCPDKTASLESPCFTLSCTHMTSQVIPRLYTVLVVSLSHIITGDPALHCVWPVAEDVITGDPNLFSLLACQSMMSSLMTQSM